MRLTKLKLMNYRCFGPEEQIILLNDLTTFIGNNSAGKTAALSALNCMFSEYSSDRILQRSDFYLPKDISPDEIQTQHLHGMNVMEKFLLLLQMMNIEKQKQSQKIFWIKLGKVRSRMTSVFCASSYLIIMSLPS